MEQLKTLEARVAAATQHLAGRFGHTQELQGQLARLEHEVGRWRTECERMQGDLVGARDQAAELEAQLTQTGGENRRLIGESNRFRDELNRFESETASLREERDRLAGLLDSLVQAVEGNSDGAAGPRGGEVVEMVRPHAAPHGLAGAGWPGHGGGEPMQARAGQDGDIPNEAARRLMDRIRDRIEAHRA